METITIISLILGLAFAYWLLTSARFRKTFGKSITDTVEVHSQGMVEQARFSRAKSKLDAIQELEDDGHNKESVTKRIGDFDEMFAPTQRAYHATTATTTADTKE